MGEINKVYLRQHGYIKLVEIVLGCICIALFHGGLYGPFSNASIEFHYPLTYNFNMAAGGVMVCLETIVLSIHALVFTEELGGHTLWYKLDLYACCLLGSFLYTFVTVLGIGHMGWPAFNFSSHVDWHLVVAAICAFFNLAWHIYDSWLNVREYGWKTNEPKQTEAVQLPVDDEEAEHQDEVKKPIVDFIEPTAVAGEQYV